LSPQETNAFAAAERLISLFIGVKHTN